MRALILVAGAALTLSACGGGNSEQNEVDTLAVDNLVVDNAAGMTGDMNAMDMNAMSGMDANTANAMAVDMNTNAPDTNLANGM